MKKSVIIILLCFTLLCLALFPTHANEAVANSITSAQGMCVLEGHSGQVLFEQNGDQKMPMASTTKIVTAILAIEHFPDLSEPVTVADQAVGIEGTSVYLQKGEQLTVKELLYGLMLASGNDAAMALALAVCPTVEDFVGKMNELAALVGATNTHFDNPHGLDSKTHYTTASDLAKLTAYALKNDDFKEIVSTKFMQITGSDHSGERHLRNKNKLLFTQENNIGVKTGFTDLAGRCLVNAVEQEDMQIITVVLNCGPMFEEARSLTNLALRIYKMKEFVKPYNYVGTTTVENGAKNSINIVSIQGYKIPIKQEDEPRYEVSYDIPQTLQAPIYKDDELGAVKVTFDGETIYEEKLISMEDIKNVDLKFMLNSIIENWF